MKLSNQSKIAIFSAACLLGLTVILKNVVGVSAEILSRDIVNYIIIFSVFGTVLPSAGEKYSSKPIYWYLAILATTLGIIAVYAL